MKKITLAGVISTAALLTSVYAVYQTRTANHLMIRPYLTVYASDGNRDYPKQFGLYVANAGPGAAIIKSFTASITDKSYDLTSSEGWVGLITQMHGDPTCYMEGSAPRDFAIKAGDSGQLLAADTKASLQCGLDIYRLLSGYDLRMKIVYSSIFGDEFVFERNVRITDARVERIGAAVADYNVKRLLLSAYPRGTYAFVLPK